MVDGTCPNWLLRSVLQLLEKDEHIDIEYSAMHQTTYNSESAVNLPMVDGISVKLLTASALRSNHQGERRYRMFNTKER
jgi:hypothetical protein